MERKYTVTMTKTVRLRLADESLAPEAVREFSETIFDADADEMLRHAASQVAAHGAHFVEGIGKAEPMGFNSTAAIEFDCEVLDVEVQEAA